MDELENKLLYAEVLYNSNEELQKHFPISFDVNIVKQYHSTCVRCNTQAPPERVRGHVTQKLKNVYELNAVAHCPECGLYNIHDAVRIREDDGVLSKQFYVTGQGWVKHIIDSENKGWIEKLLGL